MRSAGGAAGVAGVLMAALLALGCGRGVAADRTQTRLDGLFQAIAAQPPWLRGPAYARTLADAARRGTTNGAAYALCSEQGWAPTVALLEREVAGAVGVFDEAVVEVASCHGVKQLAAVFAVRSAEDFERQGFSAAAARRYQTACALGNEAACKRTVKPAPAVMAWSGKPAAEPVPVEPRLLVAVEGGKATVDGRPVAMDGLAKAVNAVADAALAVSPELATPVVFRPGKAMEIGAASEVALALLSTGLPTIAVEVTRPDGARGLIPAVALVRAHRVKRPRTGPMAKATLGGVHLGMLEGEVVALYGAPEDPAPSGPANFSPCETKVFSKGGIAVDLCEGSSTPDRRVAQVSTIPMVKPVVTNRGVGTNMKAAKVREAYKGHRNPLNPRDYLSDVAIQFVVDPKTDEVTRVSLGSAY